MQWIYNVVSGVYWLLYIYIFILFYMKLSFQQFNFNIFQLHLYVITLYILICVYKSSKDFRLRTNFSGYLKIVNLYPPNADVVTPIRESIETHTWSLTMTCSNLNSTSTHVAYKNRKLLKLYTANINLTDVFILIKILHIPIQK